MIRGKNAAKPHEFESVQGRANHDYAGVSVKLCYVFERELYRTVFQSWKDKSTSKIGKNELKVIEASAEGDLPPKKWSRF